MSNELKIGILAVVAIASSVWGYTFLKGKNMLNASDFYYVKYDDVDQLTSTAPILIKGLNVGTVTNVRLQEDMKTVVATLDINKNIKLHKDTRAKVVSTSIMGGKGVELIVPGPCKGSDCAKAGDYLEGFSEGYIQSMLAGTDIDEYVEKIKKGLGSIAKAAADSLTAPEANSAVARGLKDLTAMLSSMAHISATLENSIDSYDRRILGIMSNLQSITQNMSDNNEAISSSLNNMSEITTQFKDANVAGSIDKTMGTANETMESLTAAIKKSESALGELQKTMTAVNNGEGTLGKLVAKDDMYEQIMAVSQNFELLLQDFRLNPKRYVNVSVFGKKGKEYTYPKDDPAFKEE